MVEIGKDIYKVALGEDAPVYVQELMRNFARLYGVDFCPTYSVLGSVAS